MQTRQEIAKYELVLRLRAAESEYIELQHLAAELAERADLITEVLVADYVDANTDCLEKYRLAPEHAVRLREHNCKVASLVIYGCWAAAAVLASMTAVLGYDKRFWPAAASAGLAVASGKALPDWITLFFLKPEQGRHERWKKIRDSAMAASLRQHVVANADGSDHTGAA